MRLLIQQIDYPFMLLNQFLIYNLVFYLQGIEIMAKEAQMIKYLNLARQFPAYYISLIDKQMEMFINDKQLPFGDDVIYETNQGKSAWKEARMFLQKQTTLQPFQIHQGLNSSAKDHAVDLAINNIFGHTGSDRSLFSQRILRYCKKGQGAMVELIGADFIAPGRNNAELTILGLIIDDGVPDRGHRKTIFNPQYKFVGCKTQLQGDKIITVFNITQNRLKLKGNSELNYQNSQYGTSTLPGFNHSTKAQKGGYGFAQSHSQGNPGFYSNFSNNPGRHSNSPGVHSHQKSTSNGQENRGHNQNSKKTQNPVSQGYNSHSTQPHTSGSHGFNSYSAKSSKNEEPNRGPFYQIGKNTSNLARSTIKESFENLDDIKYQTVATSGNSKKVTRKKQNTKTIVQQGVKITQKITQVYYSDGTRQQFIQRNTLYV